MNKSSFIGFTIIAVVLYLGVFHHSKVPGIFLDPHAIMLVLGGTLAAALVAYPFKSLVRTFDYLVWGLLFKTKQKYLDISQDLANIRSCYVTGQKYVVDPNSHPFVVEAIIFLFNKNIDDEAFEEILLNRSETFRRRYKDDAKILTALGKYPPAFGLLGASTGMIEMMQNLGGGGSAGIGQAMAVALVATFWGIALANLVILPLADSASKASEEDNTLRSLVIEVMMLIRRNANDDHFQAHLRGYLNLSDRGELKIYSTKNIYSFAAAKKEAPVPKHTKVEVAAPVDSSLEASGKIEVTTPPIDLNANKKAAGAFQFKELRQNFKKKAD